MALSAILLHVSNVAEAQTLPPRSMPETTLIGPTTQAQTVTDAFVPSPPVPPALDLNYNEQSAIEARRLMQFETSHGTKVSVFPDSLLWTPPLASSNEPRMKAMISDLKNYSGRQTVDTWIGGTAGLLRYEPVDRDFSYQFDLFALVQTRLTPDDLALADYRFGFPISWQSGLYHGKIGFEHTSAHLGDEQIRQLKITNISGYRRGEIVSAAGRYFGDSFRVYGQIAYAFSGSIPQPPATLPQLAYPNRWRFDTGFEYASLVPTGVEGAPFAATNFQFRGDQNYRPNFTVQAGWRWHNPYARLANFRLFGEYYNGRSPYGFQFLDRERYYGAGMAMDF